MRLWTRGRARPRPPERASAGGAAIAGARLPALDGVRAVAIILVIVFHFRMIPAGSGLVADALASAESWGWVGVDLFFVLSGFLITGILYDSRNRPRYLRNFYIRRVLRIFPLYYVFLAFLFFVLPAVLPPGSPWRAFDWRQRWYWSYLANLDMAVHGAPMGIGHLWSLAVEEQFYFAWPFCVLLLKRRDLLRLCGVIILFAPLARWIAGNHFDPMAAYVLLPGRADALLFGAAVALIARSPDGLRALVAPARAVGLAAGAALAGLSLPRGVLNAFLLPMQIAGYSLIAALFAAILVLVLAAPGWERARTILSGPVLAVIGRYSYAMYMFHFPIASVMRQAMKDAHLAPRLFGSTIAFQAAFTGIGLAASFLVAALSWQLLEGPMLRLKDVLAPAASRGSEAPQLGSAPAV